MDPFRSAPDRSTGDKSADEQVPEFFAHNRWFQARVNEALVRETMGETQWTEHGTLWDDLEAKAVKAVALRAQLCENSDSDQTATGEVRLLFSSKNDG